MVSSLLYVGLEALGIPRAARLIRRAGIILCYHNVVSGDEAARSATPSLHTSLARFEFQMRWLARNYEIVRLRDFVERVEQGRQVRRLAALTFDDGYAGVFTHAVPLLTSLGIPATVFVIAEAPGRSDAFWWDHPDLPPSLAATGQRRLLEELRGDEHAIRETTGLRSGPAACRGLRPADWPLIATAARQGVDIGVHSATHRSLPRLTDEELQRELIMSRRIVERETGVTPEFFAYPYGLWDERVRAAVRAAGYRAAVTLDPGLNRVRADPWALRRINVPAGISNPAFRAWTAGLNPRWAPR
jgi:peptidoglycan/xylan/chitin deacetylase (PgdA/CDA1 family)